MPARAHRPPKELARRCFTREEATAAGVTSGQLFGPGYRSVMKGVWAPIDHEPPHGTEARLHDLLRALQVVLPNTAVSHLTSAQLFGMRLPRNLRAASPVHLTRWEPGRAPRMTGVCGHAALIPPADRWLWEGLRLVGPVRTIVDLAGMSVGRAAASPLMSDDGLVALLDGVINEHVTGIRAGSQALRSLTEVEQDLDRMVGRRGVARVRDSLERARVGVDSALETHARLALERHGLTGFMTDRQIHVPGLGSAYPDLADETWQISIQVDGPHHDGPGQRTRDINRLRITERAGWIEIRVTEADIFVRHPDQEPRIVALVRAARARRMRPTSATDR